MKKIKCMQIDTFKIKKKKLPAFLVFSLQLFFPEGNWFSLFCVTVYITKNLERHKEERQERALGERLTCFVSISRCGHSNSATPGSIKKVFKEIMQMDEDIRPPSLGCCHSYPH